MLYDAGFTYITMDITNCAHAWVDDRAITVIERIENWNDDLQSGDHKMFFNVALGCTRKSTGEDAFFTKLNITDYKNIDDRMTINNPGNSIELPACYLDKNRELKK